MFTSSDGRDQSCVNARTLKFVRKTDAAHMRFWHMHHHNFRVHGLAHAPSQLEFFGGGGRPQY